MCVCCRAAGTFWCIFRRKTFNKGVFSINMQISYVTQDGKMAASIVLIFNNFIFHEYFHNVFCSMNQTAKSIFNGRSTVHICIINKNQVTQFLLYYYSYSNACGFSLMSLCPAHVFVIEWMQNWSATFIAHYQRILPTTM